MLQMVSRWLFADSNERFGKRKKLDLFNLHLAKQFSILQLSKVDSDFIKAKKCVHV